MSKEKAVKLLQSEVESLVLKADNYSNAIDVRKITVNKTGEDLRGVKMAVKAIDRVGASKRYINGVYAQMVENHNQHLATLVRLKELLKETREEIFLKELILKEVG